MIYPVPPGVDPNNSRCGCDGQLKMPWDHDLQDHVLVCRVDSWHNTYQSKYKATRNLRRADGSPAEVYVATGKEITELAPITDQTTALASVQRANALELFPSKNSTPDQLALIAHVALLYRLDPMMGEIMPYQGRPYITIKGRRRLDNAVGNVVGVAHRPPTEAEEAYFTKKGAMDPRDVIQICVGTLADGRVVEGFGRVLWSEDVGTTGTARTFLPIVVRKIEMAQVRSERRMREMAFGPVGKPDGLDAALEVLQPGDEPGVVEGTATLVEEGPADDMPDLGKCPEHNVAWGVKEFHGRIVGSHFVEGEPWCKLTDVYGARLKGAWEARHGGEYIKADVDAWLKAKFHGRTWSKMDAPEMLEALTMVTTLPEAPGKPPETAPDTQPSDEPPQSPEEPPPAESALSGTGTISPHQVAELLRLADGEVPGLALALYLNGLVGDPDPDNIPADKYDEIIEWVNRQIDNQVVRAEH